MNLTAFDHRCMARAITLARRGLFTTRPNPRVGCVIAKDEAVIAEGWHERAGAPHAEIMALNHAGGRANGATVYVTLEPCAHEGRTGACASALVEAGVAHVIFAAEDPNPKVHGKGAAMLRANGIGCSSGLMAMDSKALNPGFYSRYERGRPWVRVKLAVSLDGRTALANGASAWITGEAARRDVQRWRARSCAVMSGIGTVIEDDPSLNARMAAEIPQPLRVIVDSRFRTPVKARTLKLDGPVLIAGIDANKAPKALENSDAELIEVSARGQCVDLQALLEELARREINEVQVEAGAQLCGSLLKQGLMDELLLYQAPCILGSDARAAFHLEGIEDMASRLQLKMTERISVGDDLRMRWLPQYGNQ